MPLISWKPEYSVNEIMLDRHHQKLFSILNTIYENVMTSTEVDCVIPLIDDLSKYTDYHFSAEELHMKEKGFKELEAHISRHKEFRHTIETLQMRYHDNDLDVAKELIIFLGEWLLAHVIRDDKKYSEIR